MTACIVGGGPSLADTLDELREYQTAGAEIWACNGAFRYLVEHDIFPGCFVLVDKRERNAVFVQNPITGVTYYIAEQCHPSVYRALQGCRVKRYNDYRMGAGGTVVCQAIYLAHAEGARNLHFFGVDCCYLGEQGHAYPQPMNDGEETKVLTLFGEKFRVAPWHLAQADSLRQLEEKYRDTTFTVHGNGLWAISKRNA